MNVQIGTEAAQFPEKECINGIFLAVYYTRTSATRAAFAGSLQLSSSRPGLSGKAVWTVHHSTNLTRLDHPPPVSQPGRPPCWVISLAFGLIFCKYTVKGGFFGFFLFMCDIQHCFICRLSDSTVSKDAGIEPRTVATTALAVRRSNHSARFHLTVPYLTSGMRMSC
jgi:hypothetical protein